MRYSLIVLASIFMLFVAQQSTAKVDTFTSIHYLHHYNYTTNGKAAEYSQAVHEMTWKDQDHIIRPDIALPDSILAKPSRINTAFAIMNEIISAQDINVNTKIIPMVWYKPWLGGPKQQYLRFFWNPETPGWESELTNMQVYDDSVWGFWFSLIVTLAIGLYALVKNIIIKKEKLTFGVTGIITLYACIISFMRFGGSLTTVQSVIFWSTVVFYILTGYIIAVLILFFYRLLKKGEKIKWEILKP